jgi:hypothetical protein
VCTNYEPLVIEILLKKYTQTTSVVSWYVLVVVVVKLSSVHMCIQLGVVLLTLWLLVALQSIHLRNMYLDRYPDILIFIRICRQAI